MIERIKSALILCLASLLIAIGYNLFILPNNLIAPGINGLAAIIKYSINFSPAIFILVANLSLLLIFLQPRGE